MPRIVRAALFASLTWLWCGHVLAATVVVVQPASPSPEMTEMLSRLRGELLSVGLSIEPAERAAVRQPDGPSSRASLERLAAERGLDALVDVLGDTRPEAVEIWVFRQAPRRSEVTRVVAEPNVENASARLAIRSIEVLRSFLIENRLSAAGPSPAPRGAAAITGDHGDPHAEPARQIGLEAGAALLGGLGGVGAAILPVVRVDATLGSWLALQAELAVLGSHPTVEAEGARVQVAQQYCLLGGCTCASSSRRLQPILALSAGVLRTTANGQADAPLQGHAVAHWSALLQASAGARTRLSPRSFLTLAAHVQVAEPYVSVNVTSTTVATIGHPNLLLTLTVGAWL